MGAAFSDGEEPPREQLEALAEHVQRRGREARLYPSGSKTLASQRLRSKNEWNTALPEQL